MDKPTWHDLYSYCVIDTANIDTSKVGYYSWPVSVVVSKMRHFPFLPLINPIMVRVRIFLWKPEIPVPVLVFRYQSIPESESDSFF